MQGPPRYGVQSKAIIGIRMKKTAKRSIHITTRKERRCNSALSDIICADDIVDLCVFCSPARTTDTGYEMNIYMPSRTMHTPYCPYCPYVCPARPVSCRRVHTEYYGMEYCVRGVWPVCMYVCKERERDLAFRPGGSGQGPTNQKGKKRYE